MSWGGAGTGALGGAGIGSTFGPWGAGIGAGVGGLLGGLGLFGSSKRPSSADPEADAFQQMLMARARGQGPSVVDQQAAADQARAYAQQQSMAAGARPGQEAMAQRMAMQNTGALGAQINQQAITAHLQEQQQAQDALSRWLQGNRAMQQADMQAFQSPLQRTLGAAAGVATALGGMNKPRPAAQAAPNYQPQYGGGPNDVIGWG